MEEKCIYCKGAGKIKQPNNQDEFDRLVDVEMDKGYFVNCAMAMEKAYNRVGFTLIDCPKCNGTGIQNRLV